eukprot:gene50276-biopygen40340
MAVAGVPPLVFGVVALVDLLYQFWVHTEQVGRLGWFDRWFCSPSNHRVHHAVNDRYRTATSAGRHPGGLNHTRTLSAQLRACHESFSRPQYTSVLDHSGSQLLSGLRVPY